MTVIVVRELRHVAARILARVEAGEDFGVTNNGRLVARLVPASNGAGSRAGLIAAGVLTPAVRAENLMQVIIGPVPGSARGLSEVLNEMRDGR